jgi:hypothetical protein
MGEIKQFENGMDLLLKHLSFNQDYTVSVFETTIRVLGGLLSIHLLAEDFHNKGQLNNPYNGQFLHLAQDLGIRLLPAFSTPTGLPYSRVITLNIIHHLRNQ